MWRIVLGLGIALVSASGAAAQGVQQVRPHYRSDGTFVQPHARTAPDRMPGNNWSSRGNVNPYTGERGRADPYRYPGSPRSPYRRDNRLR